MKFVVAFTLWFDCHSNLCLPKLLNYGRNHRLKFFSVKNITLKSYLKLQSFRLNLVFKYFYSSVLNCKFFLNPKVKYCLEKLNKYPAGIKVGWEDLYTPPPKRKENAQSQSKENAQPSRIVAGSSNKSSTVCPDAPWHNRWCL